MSLGGFIRTGGSGGRLFGVYNSTQTFCGSGSGGGMDGAGGAAAAVGDVGFGVLFIAVGVAFETAGVVEGGVEGVVGVVGVVGAEEVEGVGGTVGVMEIDGGKVFSSFLIMNFTWSSCFSIIS